MEGDWGTLKVSADAKMDRRFASAAGARRRRRAKRRGGDHFFVITKIAFDEDVVKASAVDEDRKMVLTELNEDSKPAVRSRRHGWRTAVQKAD